MRFLLFLVKLMAVNSIGQLVGGEVEVYLLEFIARLDSAEQELTKGDRRALTKIGKKMMTDAKNYLGEYQPATGKFPAWAPLADSTLEDKRRKGFPSPSPLLRTGELRDSIHYSVESHSVTVGSDDPVAVYQELGKSAVRLIMGD